MNKISKPSRTIFAFTFVVCAFLFILIFTYINRVVATTQGNNIYYNNETYIESFEVFDYEKDKYLGRVNFVAYDCKPKMYSILDKPDYLFVDMGRDYRIYKRIPEYKESEFIGKTSEEIIKAFGSFDCVGMPEDEDGLYKNCRCGYTIKKSKKGFLGNTPEILFFITFDENGVAIACEEGYRPGG